MPARTKSKTVLKKEQELVLFFQIQERKLNAAVDKMSRKAIRQDGATPAMLKNYREQVREILAEMQTKSADLGQALVRSAYGEGVEIADAALKANGISVIANPGMIHVQTAKVMAEAITNRFGDVTGAIGRRVDDIFRTVQLEMASASAMGYEGVKEAARNIRDELLDRGIGFFKDSAGKLWNLETYAEMAAITVTTEARNRGTWNEFAEHGEDLVIVSIHPMSCPKCEPWQGVVLSLSGNTPGYPTIHDAMADGLFHPRCRHSTVLYIPREKPDVVKPKEKVKKEKVKKPAKAKTPPQPTPKAPPAPLPPTLSYIQDSTRRQWLEDILAKSSQEIRNIFLNMNPQPGYQEVSSGGSYCSANGVTIGKDAIKMGRDRYEHVFFHEVGHWFDRINGLNGKIVSKYSMSQGSTIYDAIERDKKTFTGRSVNSVMKAQSMANEMGSGKKYYSNPSVSDIFCSMTRGKISGEWGHTESYYKKTGNANTEVFANLFDLTVRGEKDAIAFVRSFFPETVKAFEDFIADRGK
jgi:hypothetical protein